MLVLWRDIQEAYHDAVGQYFGEGKVGNTILFLQLAVRRTEALRNNEGR
jgi:hypothetical protein